MSPVREIYVALPPQVDRSWVDKIDTGIISMIIGESSYWHTMACSNLPEFFWCVTSYMIFNLLRLSSPLFQRVQNFNISYNFNKSTLDNLLIHEIDDTFLFRIIPVSTFFDNYRLCDRSDYLLHSFQNDEKENERRRIGFPLFSLPSLCCLFFVCQILSIFRHAGNFRYVRNTHGIGR